MAAKSQQELSVTLTAKTKEFSQGLDNALKSFKGWADNAAGIASKVGGIGTALTAAFGGALVLAAANSKELSAASQGLKDTMASLNEEIAVALAPTLTVLANKAQELLAVWQNLNPALKESIVEWGAMFAAASVGLVVLGKTLELFSGLTQAAMMLKGGLGVVAKAMGLVSATGKLALLPFIKFIAIGAAVVLLAGVIYKAWKDNSDKIKALFSAFIATVSEWANSIGQLFASIWDSVREFVMSAVTWILDKMAGMIRRIAGPLQKAARALGLDSLADGLGTLSNLTGEQLAKGMKDGAAALAKSAIHAGKVVGGAVGGALRYGVDGLSQAKDDLKDLIGGVIGGGTAAAAGTKSAGDSDAAKEAAEANLKQVQEGTRLIGLSRKWNLKYNQDRARILKEEADRQKKLDDERAKLLAAEKQRVSDFWGNRNSESGAINGLAGQALGMTGSAGSMVQGISQGAAVGGPLGALAGGAMALLGDTQALEKLMSALQPVMDALVSVLDAVLLPVIEVLTPIFGTVGMLMESLAPVLEILNMGLRFLQPVFEALSQVVGWLAIQITKVTNWIFEQAAKIISIFSKNAADQLRSRIKNVDEMQEQLNRLTKGIGNVSDEVNKAAESMDSSNLPSAWRMALRVMQAGAPSASRRSSTVIENHLTLTIDGKQVAATVNSHNDRSMRRNTGAVPGGFGSGRMRLA